jgi:ketosteroid isomerase-like protein
MEDLTVTRDELAAINEGVAAALTNQDIDRALTFYCDDVLVVLPGRPNLRGLSQLAAYFRESFRTGPQHVQFDSNYVLEDVNLVVDVGRYVTFGPTGPSGPVQDRGKYIAVYRRKGGALKMAVDATISDGP